jgi:hypothetical protein
MCPIGFLWALPCKTCRAIRPPHAISLPQEASLAAHRLPPTNDPPVHPASPGRPRGRAGTAQPPPDDDGQVQTDASAGPAPPAPAPRRGADSGRRRAGHGRSGRPRRPRPSQPYGCLPTPRSRTSLRPDTADAATHRHRTPAPDTGHGPVDRQAWILVARTGHRTPDAGRGRGQVTTARPASGPPGPPRRATARWDAQPCSCGRRLRRSTAHAGSAVRLPSSARWRLAGSCLVAPPGSSGALAHCCPRTITGRA